MGERRQFVGVRLSPAGIAALKAVADETGNTISDVIRLAIKHGLPAASRDLHKRG